MLDVVGLAEYADAPAEILSYGQRKLLAIAASIMARPKLVMLDEPVAGVNPTMIKRIEEVIRKITSSIVLDGQLDSCELTFADLEKIHPLWTYEKKLKSWGIDEIKSQKKR